MRNKCLWKGKKTQTFYQNYINLLEPNPVPDTRGHRESPAAGSSVPTATAARSAVRRLMTLTAIASEPRRHTRCPPGKEKQGAARPHPDRRASGHPGAVSPTSASGRPAPIWIREERLRAPGYVLEGQSAPESVQTGGHAVHTPRRATVSSRPAHAFLRHVF